MSIHKNIKIIGSPLDLGAEELGVDKGPEAIRGRDVVTKLQDAGLRVSDHGDLKVRKRASLEVGDPLLPYIDEIVRSNTELAELVEEAIRSGETPVIIGGDHSVNLGAFSGAVAGTEETVGMIYIDAHGDMNTPESSVSHNIHGMHLASLMGLGPESMTQLHKPGVKLPKDRLLHIAGSDLDKAEIDLLTNENIAAFTIYDLLKDGMGRLFDMIIDLNSKVDHVWVSVDLDAIDTVYAPGVGIPNQGGLSYREVAALMTYIGEHSSVIGMDVVEYNPNFDIDYKTAELAIEIIAKLLGTNYSWYTNYMLRQR